VPSPVGVRHPNGFVKRFGVCLTRSSVPRLSAPDASAVGARLSSVSPDIGSVSQFRQKATTLTSTVVVQQEDPPTIAHAFDETERCLKPASSETAKPELRLVPHFSRTAKLFAVSCASSRDSVPAETLRRLADTCGLENVAALLRRLTRDGEGSSR
jgi:hypothetical protein